MQSVCACPFAFSCKFTYDAWNRLAKVQRAWESSDNALHEGSIIGTITFDGLGRRVVKTVTNCGSGWNTTHKHYHDGDRVVEERNGQNTPVN